MENNYYFIDGSSLMAQIRTIWKKSPEYNWLRLDPVKLINQLQFLSPELGSSSFKRAQFYFPAGEQNIDTHLLMPDSTQPRLIRDIHFKYCGEKLDRSTAYEKWLESVPPQWLDRCVKSEKGIDIEICCDALRLASSGKMDRLFLLTNDRDFLPLFKVLKDFGVNISLIHLSNFTNPNKTLLDESDSYDILNPEHLRSIFEPKKEIMTIDNISNITDPAETTTPPQP